MTEQQQPQRPWQYQYPHHQRQSTTTRTSTSPPPPAAPAGGERSMSSRRTTVSSLNLLPSTILTEQSWRRFGKARRRELIENDSSSGSDFRINPQCNIAKYFALAERVIHQFRALCNNTTNNTTTENNSNQSAIEDAYVLGHRLVAFLSAALPRHPAYHAAAHLSQRKQCVTQTVQIRARLKQLAVAIDEAQLNRYVEHEYDPPHDDDDDDDDDSSTESGSRNSPNVSSSSQQQQQQQQPWESFDGWSASAPGLVDTDESSYDDEVVVASSFLLEQLSAHDSSTQHSFSYEEYYAADPELDNVSLGSSSTSNSSSCSNGDGRETVYFSNRASPTFDVDDYDDDDDPDYDDDLPIDPDDDDDDVDEVDPPLSSPVSAASFEFQTTVSSFLEKIAEEDVSYETDSEAADSWAPDGDGDSKTTALADLEKQTSSSSSALVCDPARRALGEILNRHADLVTAMDREIAHCCHGDGDVLPPPPPHNSPEDWTGAKQVGFSHGPVRTYAP